MAVTDAQPALFLIKNTPLKENGPLYLRVAEVIAELIDGGSLKRGAAMPRVRDLAEGLRVSIVTAHHAYRVLGERGLLAGRPGVGTFVAQPPAKPFDPPLPDAQSLAWQEAFNRPKAPTNLGYIYRLPTSCSQAAFPFFSVPAYGGELLAPTKRAMRRIALDAELGSIHPTDTQGLPELRTAVAPHLHDEGIDAGADRVLVTNSYEESLVLTLLSFCHEGDAVVMEDPSQFCLIDAARLRGSRANTAHRDDAARPEPDGRRTQRPAPPAASRTCRQTQLADLRVRSVRTADVPRAAAAAALLHRSRRPRRLCAPRFPRPADEHGRDRRHRQNPRTSGA